MTPDPECTWLVRDRYAPLVGMLTLQVGDRDVAEELAQDALVTLIRHWDRVRAMDNPSAWLTTVAFNQARSWWRRSYAQQRARRRHGPTVTTTDSPDTETSMVVRAAVGELPARQRQAIILRYFHGYSVLEAAEIMECAEGTVKSLTSQARATLRERDLHGVSLAPPGEHAEDTAAGPSRSSRGRAARTEPSATTGTSTDHATSQDKELP